MPLDRVHRDISGCGGRRGSDSGARAITTSLVGGNNAVADVHACPRAYGAQSPDRRLANFLAGRRRKPLSPCVHRWRCPRDGIARRKRRSRRCRLRRVRHPGRSFRPTAAGGVGGTRARRVNVVSTTSRVRWILPAYPGGPFCERLRVGLDRDLRRPPPVSPLGHSDRADQTTVRRGCAPPARSGYDTEACCRNPEDGQARR